MKHEILSVSPEHTAQIAMVFAKLAKSGDVFLLQGVVGAGKTHFARIFIQYILEKAGQCEDIPSPTFTLVQVYETPDFDIWHSDLYRVSTSDELYELGLEMAFDTGVCLVEWSDRLGDLAPQNAMNICIKFTKDHKRSLMFSWSDHRWDEILYDLKKIQG